MTAINQIIRQISMTTVLGALALTLAAYGTVTTVVDAGRPAACQDRLVKVGQLPKEDMLYKDGNDTLGSKEDGTPMDKEDALGTKDDGTPMSKDDDFDKDNTLGVDSL